MVAISCESLKEPSSWLSACAFLLNVLFVSLSRWCLGQNVEFDCIGSCSLPFYLLCSVSSLHVTEFKLNDCTEKLMRAIHFMPQLKPLTQGLGWCDRLLRKSKYTLLVIYFT